MVESQTELALKSLSLSQSTGAFLSNKHKREKYHIGMTLSEGHFATVKQCEEKATGKEHLLRVVNKAKVFGREDLILREVTIMKMLRQENVMQVLDHWETTDDMHLVIEQIEVSWTSFSDECFITGVPYTLAKLAICYYILHFGYQSLD